jgi:N-acyl-phosphatidylethanolamine-hydrolysing phospholipase D
MPDSLYAPHRGEGVFFNPWGDFPHGTLNFLKLALSRNPYTETHPLEVDFVRNDGADLSTVQHSAKVTWIGHASFAIHDKGDVVLTDPHFSRRALVVPRRFPPGVPLEAVPSHAFAVVSHNHYDHLDSHTVASLPDTVDWFVPLGLADWFRARGRERVVELDWWQSARRGRWTITCLPAQHWSRRFSQGMNESLWCGWLLDSGDYTYYFAGDTGYFHGFAEFGRRFGLIDVALLPIGAYEPRWFMAYQHMDPADAHRAFQDLGARYMIPMHWGTFKLTQEPPDEPARELKRVIAAAGGDPSRAPILGIGQGWHVPPRAAEALSAAQT